MIRKLGSILAVGALLVGLAGCYGDSENLSDASDFSSAPKWSNYKCVATGGGHQYTGWATGQSEAKSNAMEKCRSHSSGCQIAQCSGE